MNVFASVSESASCKVQNPMQFPECIIAKQYIRTYDYEILGYDSTDFEFVPSDRHFNLDGLICN
jgi:hypothetical protein